MKKATFLLPEWQLETLRERSRKEQRSLSEVAAEVIARGLGRPAVVPGQSAIVAALGSLLARPALQAYEVADHQSSQVDLTKGLWEQPKT